VAALIRSGRGFRAPRTARAAVAETLAETLAEAGAEAGCGRHAAHHRLRGPGPDRQHRPPGLLRLGVGQIGRDLALPYGDPILGQGPEIVLRPRHALRRTVWPGSRLAVPRRLFTVIHVLSLLLRRRQVVPGQAFFPYD